MIEVFITDIKNECDIKSVLKPLAFHFPNLKINFDLNETKMPFPCGHTILRVESATIYPEKIISLVQKSGFQCEVLEDKISIK